MPFTKKYPNSGETAHIRVPAIYSELILDLMEIMDKRFDADKGKHILRKFIHNLT